jgi:hypothetical protein
MDFWNVVAAAAAVVAIATVAGLGLQRGYTVSLREQLGSARNQIDAQRAEIDELKRERVEDMAALARQSNDIAVLQRVITGEVHWQAISELLDFHHQSAESHATRIENSLGTILDELRRTA